MWSFLLTFEFPPRLTRLRLDVAVGVRQRRHVELVHGVVEDLHAAEEHGEPHLRGKSVVRRRTRGGVRDKNLSKYVQNFFRYP